MYSYVMWTHICVAENVREVSFTNSQMFQGTVLLYNSSSKIMSSINLNLPDTHAH